MTGEYATRVFFALLQQSALPTPTPEFRFHPTRKWRFDYAWPAHRLALEVEGGSWSAGRHTRGAGFALDLEKYNTATALGWRLLRVTPPMLATIRTRDWIADALTLTPAA